MKGQRSGQCCRECSEHPPPAAIAQIESKAEAEQTRVETLRRTQEPCTSVCDPVMCVEQEQEIAGWNLKSDNFYVHMDDQEWPEFG